MNTQHASKHTPGPCYYDTESDHRYIRQESTDRPVARITDSAYPDKSHAWTEDEMTAHGHLFAAAPTMYNYLTLLASRGDNEAHEILSKIHA